MLHPSRRRWWPSLLAAALLVLAVPGLVLAHAELETPTPPTRSKVLMANGKVLAYFYDENRIPVALGKIAPVMRQAQLAIEDHRFYEHGAMDMKGTMRALVRNTASDGSTQGGSTISQQYVKMVQVEACQAKGDEVCAKAAIAPTVERVPIQSETTMPSNPHSSRSTPRSSSACSLIVVPLTLL